MKLFHTFAAFVTVVLPAVAQFTEINPGLPAPPYPCVAWGDYDNDGDLDVLVAGEGKKDTRFATIYKNTGGVFADSGIALLGVGRATAAWGDFDNDGDLDLALTGETGNGAVATRVYRNDGNVFTVVSGNFVNVFAGSVVWGDYDGDGDLDLLITGITSASASGQAVTRLYRNDGGTFTSVPHPFPNSYLGGVAWGDYDNDGDLDLVMAGALTGGGLTAAIWRNDGGTFTDSGASLPAADLGFAVWGDYDGDGDLDLLYGGNSVEGWITRLYRNDAGHFVDSNAGLLGVLWASAAWGDYDNDGDLDAMIIGYDAVAQTSRSILYKNVEGTLQESGISFHNLYLGTVAWMDFDNDGDLDLLLAGNESGVGDYLKILKNGTTSRNDPPETPLSPGSTVEGTNVLLSWSAAHDQQTPAAALTYNVRVGTTPGGMEIVTPQSSSAGYRRLPAPGDAGQKLGLYLRGLVPGTTYYWAVQSVDTGFAGSAFTAEGSFAITAEGPQNVAFTREAAGFRAVWRGTPGALYQIQISEDLDTWSTMSSATAAAGTGLFQMVDTPAAGTRQRFYRAVLPPVSSLSQAPERTKKTTAHARPHHRR